MCGKVIKPSRHLGPATSPRLVDFIITALNDGRYGEFLSWVDKREGIFKIKYKHKNTSNWSPGSAVVFMGWDQLKGRCCPSKEGYFTKSRQRFKAAALKSPDIHKLSNSKSRNEEIFQLRFDKKRAHFGGPESNGQCRSQDDSIQVNQISSSYFEMLGTTVPHHSHESTAGPWQTSTAPVNSLEAADAGSYTTAVQYSNFLPFEMQSLLELFHASMNLEEDPQLLNSFISESILLESGLYAQAPAEYQVF